MKIIRFRYKWWRLKEALSYMVFEDSIPTYIEGDFVHHSGHWWRCMPKKNSLGRDVNSLMTLHIPPSEVPNEIKMLALLLTG